MPETSDSTLAPVSLPLWGCDIIIVWWCIVLSLLGGAVWVLVAGVRLALGH